MSPTLDLLGTTRLAWAAAIVLITIVLRFWQKLHYHRTLVKACLDHRFPICLVL